MKLHEAVAYLCKGRLLTQPIPDGRTTGHYVLGIKTCSIFAERGCSKAHPRDKDPCKKCESKPLCAKRNDREVFHVIEVDYDGNFVALRGQIEPEDLLSDWEFVQEGSPLVKTFKDFLESWKVREFT